MKILVVCDSVYGNTENIAKAIYTSLAKNNVVNFLRVSESGADNFQGTELIIIGSPTRGGRPTPAMDGFIENIKQDSFIGVKVATFDTRFLESAQNFALRLLMRTIGYAADKIMSSLIKKGGQKITEPEGFIVTGSEGPLRTGELERAASWAEEIVRKAS